MAASAISLGKFRISEDSQCFIIAEICHNHQGSVELARKMIVEAAKCGAHAVKLQKRSNRDLFTLEMYNRPYDSENSFGATYGEHREALEFGEKEYLELKEYAEGLGLVFFATPFDIQSVEFLERVGVPAYKVASACITDTPLLERIGKTGKPVFLSTGTSNEEDVDRAYSVLKKSGSPLCLLHCVAAYPMMNYKEANLKAISTMKTRYPDALIGFSSHESGIVLPVVAYMLGARVVEKHFTLNRAMKGTDQHFSLEPQGLEKMARDLSRIYESLGDGVKVIQPSELDAKKKLGKSIYALLDIPEGAVLSPEMIAFKSPAIGLPPYAVDDILGRTVKKAIPKDGAIRMEDVSPERVRDFGKVDWGAVFGKKS